MQPELLEAMRSSHVALYARAWHALKHSFYLPPAAPAEIDVGGLRLVRLRMRQADGGECLIDLLRSGQWLADHGAQLGGGIFLNMPEMSVEGQAEVLAIEPCPPLEPGEGRLITGAFRHASGEVYDLKLAGESKPIGVTATHPFWSCDRNTWVSAIDLHTGETLKTLVGTTVVESRRKRAVCEPVYNIEVGCDHAYKVGESGVLAHNNSADEAGCCAHEKNGLPASAYAFSKNPASAEAKFKQLAKKREEWGIPPIPPNEEHTVAKLEVDGKVFWGRNAATSERIFPIGVGVNDAMWRHAEGDVLTQAFKAKVKLCGATARLYTDRKLCAFCNESRGVENMAAYLGLKTLQIFTPLGKLVFEWNA